MIMLHKLKTTKCYFDAIDEGLKTFEIRYNDDRGFQKGDVVCLEELSDNGGYRTGNKIFLTITYVTAFKQREGWVVFGFEKGTEEEQKLLRGIV